MNPSERRTQIDNLENEYENLQKASHLIWQAVRTLKQSCPHTHKEILPSWSNRFYCPDCDSIVIESDPVGEYLKKNS